MSDRMKGRLLADNSNGAASWAANVTCLFGDDLTLIRVIGIRIRALWTVNIKRLSVLAQAMHHHMKMLNLDREDGSLARDSSLNARHMFH